MAGFVERLGFEPVLIGPLAAGVALQAGSHAFGAALRREALLRSVGDFLPRDGHAVTTVESTPRDGVCARFQELFEIVGRRWSVAIVIAASQGGKRFGEIRDGVPGISERLLAERLRELTSHGILERCIDGDPAVARYRLTTCGNDLVEQLGPVISWAERWN